MKVEERAVDFIERLLIDVHWHGERSEHPADVAWTASRVRQLMPQVMPLFLAAQREAEAETIKRCGNVAENRDFIGAPNCVGEIWRSIRALPTAYGDPQEEANDEAFRSD